MLEIFSPGRMSLLFHYNGNFIYVTWILMLHTTLTFSILRVSSIGLSLLLCISFYHVSIIDCNKSTSHRLQHFSPMAQQPLMGQGLLIIEASRSHSDTPHSVGLLWTSDQPVTHTPCGVRTPQYHNKRVAADPRLR